MRKKVDLIFQVTVTPQACAAELNNMSESLFILKVNLNTEVIPKGIETTKITKGTRKLFIIRFIIIFLSVLLL